MILGMVKDHGEEKWMWEKILQPVYDMGNSSLPSRFWVGHLVATLVKDYHGNQANWLLWSLRNIPKFLRDVKFP